MQHRALVIEDDANIAESVADTLESLGHEHVWVKSQEEARKHLGSGDDGGFTYVLLDLQIPVRHGRGLPRIEYGEHLAKEIHQTPSLSGVPIIVMTAYGKEGLEIAAPLCEHGVVDFINKPFPPTGRTLASVIQSALDRTYRKRERTTKNLKPEKPFTGGELTLYEDRIELCGVTVVSSRKSCQMWSILETLKQKLSDGRYKAFPGSAVPSRGGQNSIAGSVRDFRRHASEQLGRELGLKVEKNDVIQTSKAGYRLNAKIAVKDLRIARPHPAATGRPKVDGEQVPAVSDDSTNGRREQIMTLIRSGERLRIPGFAERLHCGYTTAKREMEALKAEGLVEFVGPGKTGYYQLVSLPRLAEAKS